MRPLMEIAGSAGQVGSPAFRARVVALLDSASSVSVLFSQERLDEFSKQKNEKGEYSVNGLHKNSVLIFSILFNHFPPHF